jgi:mono/diheme cytochrome c family protein
MALVLTPFLLRPSRREHFDAGLGRPLPAASLQRLDGRSVPLGELIGPRGLVIVFLGTQCPVGNQYAPKLAALAGWAGPRGVAVIGVNANASETAEQVAAHARDFRLGFPVLKDPENRAADLWRVGRTNEALLLDAKGILRYRGAIDDEYRPGIPKGQAPRPFLANAIGAMLAARPITVATTPVFGCPIERVLPRIARPALPRVRAAAPAIVAAREADSGPIAVGPVTYAADVAPILAERCQGCHRPRQVAPFSLLTYEDALRWASGIAEVVEDYRMPPWHADPRYGRFANDRSLSPRERAVLLAWVDQGAPAGDLAAAPPPRRFPEGWTIGTPDLVFTMDEPFEVPASGTIPIQRFRIKSGATRDLWVQKAEMQPGDRSVVHHMFVFVEPHRDDGDLTRTGPCLVAYAPGDAPSVYPPGVAKRIPAGCDLLFEIHYTPIGRPRVDRSSVGIILATEPVQHEAVFTGIADKQLVIPPGATHHRSRSSHTFTKHIHLLSLFPHMHLRGKDFRIDAVFPDGRREILLSIPAYDYAWQSVYRLAQPLALPAGSRIECEAHFDNSAANPANPDPTATVRWGDQTWDEMMIGYLDYYEDRPDEEGSIRPR